MSEKQCKICGALLEDENSELCPDCLNADSEAANEETLAQTQEETAEELVPEQSDKSDYIDYEVVEEAPSAPSCLALKIISAVLGLIGGGYVFYYVIDLIGGFKEYLQQYIDMGMKIGVDIPASYMTIQYIYFATFFLVGGAALLGVIFLFFRKTNIASAILFAFSSAWGVTQGIPQFFSVILDEQSQQPLKLTDPSVLVAFTGLLLVAAAVLAGVMSAKTAKASAAAVKDEPVNIEPLAFDYASPSDEEAADEEASDGEEIIVVDDEEQN